MPEAREWEWNLRQVRSEGEEPKGEQKAREGQGQCRKVTMARGPQKLKDLFVSEDRGSRLRRKAERK